MSPIKPYFNRVSQDLDIKRPKSVYIVNREKNSNMLNLEINIPKCETEKSFNDYFPTEKSTHNSPALKKNIFLTTRNSVEKPSIRIRSITKFFSPTKNNTSDLKAKNDTSKSYNTINSIDFTNKNKTSQIHQSEKKKNSLFQSPTAKSGLKHQGFSTKKENNSPTNKVKIFVTSEKIQKEMVEKKENEKELENSQSKSSKPHIFVNKKDIYLLKKNIRYLKENTPNENIFSIARETTSSR